MWSHTANNYLYKLPRILGVKLCWVGTCLLFNSVSITVRVFVNSSSWPLSWVEKCPCQSSMARTLSFHSIFRCHIALPFVVHIWTLVDIFCGQMNITFSSFADRLSTSRLCGQEFSETNFSALGLCQTCGVFLSSSTKNPDTSARLKAKLCIPYAHRTSGRHLPT